MVNRSLFTALVFAALFHSGMVLRILLMELTESLVIDWLCAAYVASVASSWILIDSHFRRHPLLHLSQHLCFFAWPVAATFYLLKTRRLAGFGWTVLHIFGFIADVMIGMILAYFVTGRVLL